MGLFNDLPSKNELKGSFGEWLTKRYSKTYYDALILHDVLINGNDEYTSQIDMLMVGNKGVYVVEVKMYDEAIIYGDGNKSEWYYYKNGKKYNIYSPKKQNDMHIKYLKSFLKDFGEVPCFSVLTVICKDFKVSNVNSGDSIDTVICNSLPAMDRGLKVIAKDKPVVFDDNMKKEIFEYIKNNQLKGKEIRKTHKENTINYKAKLNTEKEEKICPYCKTHLILRNGKYGKFYGCSNYPKCKYTQKTD